MSSADKIWDILAASGSAFSYAVMISPLPARLNRKIGRALHDYRMLEEGDRVLVAVSGGVDSLVLAVVLHLWQAKAPISFQLLPVHIDHGFSEPGSEPEQNISPQLARHELFLEIVKETPLEQERSCFLCARNRRKMLFDLAAAKGFNKIALGHHRDDLVETFLLNAVYSGNISTMRPMQSLFDGSLSLLRPLAYLEKDDVLALAALWRLQPVKNLCPFAENTRRETIRRFLAELHRQEPGAKDSLFAALGNVRRDYLL